MHTVSPAHPINIQPEKGTQMTKPFTPDMVDSFRATQPALQTAVEKIWSRYCEILGVGAPSIEKIYWGDPGDATIWIRYLVYGRDEDADLPVSWLSDANWEEKAIADPQRKAWAESLKHYRSVCSRQAEATARLFTGTHRATD